MLTGKAAVVCRECLWEQRVDLCGRDASQQRSHCREPGLNHVHALVREASGPAPFQADVRPLLASPDIMGVGVRVPRSPAWSSLNHSWHVSLIQLGKEQCSPPACHAHRGLGLIRQLVGSQWAKAPSPTGLGASRGGSVLSLWLGDAVPQLEPPHRPWGRWWSLLHLVAGEKANGVWGGETTLRPGRALFTSKRELSFQIRAWVLLMKD